MRMHEKMKRKRCVRREMIARHSQMNVREGGMDRHGKRKRDELAGNPRWTDSQADRQNCQETSFQEGSYFTWKHFDFKAATDAIYSVIRWSWCSSSWRIEIYSLIFTRTWDENNDMMVGRQSWLRNDFHQSRDIKERLVHVFQDNIRCISSHETMKGYHL